MDRTGAPAQGAGGLAPCDKRGRMLRYALRRALWSIPTLLATSLFLFLVTTLAPDPDQDVRNPASGPQLEEARRARFLNLPRFFNADAKDVRSRARDALSHVAAGDAQREAGARELYRLGGAALPFVLPQLETLAPDARRRVAAALAPLAQRMGLASPTDLSAPEAAALFWTRFWDDRSLDFTRVAVQRAVMRLVEHGSDLREGDLSAVDTFALPEVIGAMASAHDGVTLARLARLASHATERAPVPDAQSTADEIRRARADWREWWFVCGTDFVPLVGADRAIAVVTETRYGKWLRRAVSGELGLSAIDGEPVAEKLARRAPLTLLLCSL